MKRRHSVVAMVLSLSCIFTSSMYGFTEEVKYSENLIPVMTSNAGADGVVPFASSEYGSGRVTYKAFDGKFTGPYSEDSWESATGDGKGILGVKFPEPKRVTKMVIASCQGYSISSWDVEASNNGSTWTNLGTFTKSTWASFEPYAFTFKNDLKYTQYRINIKSPYGSNYALVGELSMYSPLEVPTPVVQPTIKITAPEKVNAGSTFDVYVSAENVQSIYAEALSFLADNNAFQVLNIEEVSDKQDSYSQIDLPTSDSNGVSMILASKGEETGLNTSDTLKEEQLLKITLKALNVPSGTVKIKDALIANDKGIEIVPVMDEKTIQILQVDADVNEDGRYSLGDLAMAAFNKQKDKLNWSTAKADVDKSDSVDETDLKLIVEKILQNI